MPRLVSSVALIAGVVLGVAGALGWYYSDELLVPSAPPEVVADIAVLEGPEDGTITVTRTAQTERAGVFGLRLEDGYVQLGGVVGLEPDGVEREVLLLEGTVVVGDQGALDDAAYPEDPTAAFDFDVDQVSLPSELGPLPSYFVDGSSDTWAVLVHGRGGTRAETFRMLPILKEAGVPALAISYRNDPDTDAGDGRYGLGSTEWRDLDTAVDYAVANGASEVVLVGYSAGGSIVGEWLRRSEQAELAAGVIYDAPILQWGPVLEQAVSDRGLPSFLTPLAMAVVELRTPVDFSSLDQVARAAQLDVPALIFHGLEDRVVSINSSAALEDARPDLVELVPIPGAEHLESANVDPLIYREKVLMFLAEIGAT